MTIRLAAALGALLLATRPAAADPDSGVDAQTYRPSIDPSGALTLEGARGMARHDFALKVGVVYSQDPLKLAVPGIGAMPTDDSTDSVLKSTLGLDIAAAFGVSDKLTVGFDVGLVQTSTADGYGKRGLFRTGGPDKSTGLLSLRPVTSFDPSGGFADEGLDVPLDARLGAKYRFLSGKKLAAALALIVSVPFGDEQMFLGDQSFVFEPRVALDYTAGAGAHVIVNVGTKVRKRTVLEAYNAQVADQTPDDAQVVMDIGSELLAGAGFVYAAAPQLVLAAEANLLFPLPASMSWGSCRRYSGARCSDIDDADYFAGGSYGNTAVDALAGVHYRITPDASIAVAGGAGLLGEGRSADFRIVGGVSWAPTPAGTRAIGRGDRDADEVPDSTDICADEPEDRDGYQDEDGCPERDNDGDGVPDVTDRCPNDKEDFDQFEDDDGCPEEDNDGDGIADAKDKCPNDAETVNGHEDLDGCPDQRIKGGPQLVGDRIDLRGDRISFAAGTDRLTRGSQDVLDTVAERMKEVPNAVFRVEVHVALGTRARQPARIKAQRRLDKQLAQRRAEVVRTYLVGKGVPRSLLAVGVGSERNIAEPPTDPANDRVDFIRVQQVQP